MKLFTIAIAISAGLLSANPSFAHGNKAAQRAENGIPRVLSQLALSEAQQADIQLIMQQVRAEAALVKQNMPKSHGQMKALMYQEQWDAELATQIAEQRLQRSSSMQFTRANAMHQAYNVLTDSQKLALASKPQMREDKQGNGKGRDRSMLNNPRLQKSLALSAQQITDVQAIYAGVQKDNAPLRSELRAFKQAERALIQSDEFSQEAWESLYLDAKPSMVSMRVNQLNARYNMKNVLTAEQVTKLQSMPKRKKAKMKSQFRPA